MRFLRPTAPLLLALSLAACGGSSASHHTNATAAHSSTGSASPVAAHAGAVSIPISNYAFHPDKVTVAPGTKITFTNHDQTAHTATSNNPGFDTGTLNPGASRTVVLTQPGTYTYYCQFHAFMRGTVVVK